MKNTERLLLKEKILNHVAETKSKIIDYEELCLPIAPENAIGRVSRMDAINNKSVVEAALRSARRKLEKLETALQKINDPAFGNCTVCKRNINPKRLMLMPESNRCVNCASR